LFRTIIIEQNINSGRIEIIVLTIFNGPKKYKYGDNQNDNRQWDKPVDNSHLVAFDANR